MILAGDIGGTNARLAFFDVQDGHFRLVSSSVFPCCEYAGLDQIVSKFVDTSKLHPDAACFGVPGPVRNGRVETSNLPWIIESKRLADELNLKQAVLINDLEANAWGIAALDPSDVVPLNKGKGIRSAIRPSSLRALGLAKLACIGMARNIAFLPPKEAIAISLPATDWR